MAKPSPWKKLSSKTVFKNPWFKVRQDEVVRPDGKPGQYNVVEVVPCVFIVALNETGNEFCLIHEYRYPPEMWMWEIPVGAVDATDATPLDAAKHELQEETGFTAAKWEYVSESRGLKGAVNQTRHIFIARDLTATGQHTKLEEGIDDVRFISFEDFFREVKEGKIPDAETVASVTCAAIHLGKIPTS